MEDHDNMAVSPREWFREVLGLCSYLYAYHHMLTISPQHSNSILEAVECVLERLGQAAHDPPTAYGPVTDSQTGYEPALSDRHRVSEAPSYPPVSLEPAPTDMREDTWVASEDLSSILYEVRLACCNLKLFHRLLRLEPEYRDLHLDRIAILLDRLVHAINHALEPSELAADTFTGYEPALGGDHNDASERTYVWRAKSSSVRGTR